MTPTRDRPFPFHAVILAGGRGTRFWPLSRKRLPKQLLPVVGETALLRQTVERLKPFVPPQRIWVFANEILREPIKALLPEIPPSQVIAEPLQRNTAPAIALAARLLLARDPNAIMGVFPSDHFIGKPAVFAKVIQRAIKAAQRGGLVVMGNPPQWPETGYGYIEFPKGTAKGGVKAVPVVRFREKPNLPTAKRFLKAGYFYWNSGMFVWQARVIAQAIEDFLPKTARAVAGIPSEDSAGFQAALRRRYPDCEDISIDYGVLERAQDIVGFPCPDFGWSDVGSWEAVYNLRPKDKIGNVERTPVLVENSSGNYVDAPGKLVALLHVTDLIIVDTPDALLICPRKEAQKVSAIVKALEKAGLEKLL
jgi:mannose-1-phosphate guanylyltransferase